MRTYIDDLLRRLFRHNSNGYHMIEIMPVGEGGRCIMYDRYTKWMTHQFLSLRLIFCSDLNLNDKSHRTRISHWIPFIYDHDSVTAAEQVMHAWSPIYKSVNIKIKGDTPFIFHRNPVGNSTDAIRGKMGYSNGIHIWKISWPQSMRGTHAVVGVATNQSRLQYDSYVSLVGFDNESWGWDIVSMMKVHGLESNNPINAHKYPNLSKLSPKIKVDKNYKVPETIYVILDMYQGTLAFMVQNVFLGVAHTGLQGKTLYPTVSAVWGHCEISLEYYNGITTVVPSLKSLCLQQAKRLVRYHCAFNAQCPHNGSSDFRKVIRSLDLPKSIKRTVLENMSPSMIF